MLAKNVIPFLTELKSNNNKTWFEKNKTWYQTASKEFKDFIDDLIPQLVKTEPRLAGLAAKDCVYRIFRDVRFSTDKTPYKPNFAANIAPGGKNSKLASFYVHIDLLKHKHYIVLTELSAVDIASESLLPKLVDVHRILQPFNLLLNTILDDAGLK